jgi:phosphoglycolate phosphatase
MKPDSIIFDIDGTLWNSTPIVADAWNEVLKDRPDVPVTITAQWLTQLFGRPLHVIADMIFPFLEENDRYELIERCCEREHEFLCASKQNILYPKVAETIRTLSRHYPLYIVSNCQDGYIELFLEKTGLTDYIKDSECPGTSKRSKGTSIRMLMERNHLQAPVYVGDIEGDRLACVEAKIPFCHASYGFGEVEKADYVIKNFEDLLTTF